MSDHKHDDISRDVDLVPILSYFGRGIKNFFKAIGKGIAAIGHFIILFLVFIQKNVIVVGLFTMLGLGFGFYLKYAQKELFSAQLNVQPNFNSTRQLYSRVDYFNSLIDEKNHSLLAQELGIDEEGAAYLSSFKIEPVKDESVLLAEYDDIAVFRDTTSLKFLDYDFYKGSLDKYDYKLHELRVSSTNRKVLEEMLERVLDIPMTNGIRSAKRAYKENADYSLRELKAQLAALDTLVYNLARSKRSDKEEGSTNFYVNNQQGTFYLTDVFKRKEKLLREIQQAELQKSNLDQTITIHSRLLKWGTIKRQYNLIKSTLAGFGFGLLIALLPIVWKFLKNYKTDD